MTSNRTDSTSNRTAVLRKLCCELCLSMWNNVADVSNEPRFACRVREDDFTKAEEEAEEFFVYQFGGGSAFSHFIWLDPQPKLDELTELLARAADFVEAFDE